MFDLHLLEPLEEVSLSRIERHWRTNGFAALTAWRHDEPDRRNRSMLADLKTRVKRAGYGWVQVMGAWSEEGGKPAYEPSLIIPSLRVDSGRDEASLTRDSRDLRALAIEWGARYKQWGVLFVRPGGKAEVITTNPRLTGKPNGTVEDTFSAFRAGDTRADIRTIKGVQSTTSLVSSLVLSLIRPLLRPPRGPWCRPLCRPPRCGPP